MWLTVTEKCNIIEIAIQNHMAFRNSIIIIFRNFVKVKLFLQSFVNLLRLHKKRGVTMSKLYERIESLCKENGINITKMCTQAGISRGSLTDLKVGRSKTLNNFTMVKIAEFFNVTTDYLSGLTDVKIKTLNDSDLKFALFNETEGITDEMYEEVKWYAEMVKLREESKKKKK